MKRIALSMAAAAFLSSWAGALDVPITVKETAQTGAVSWPTTVVVPLPRGQYMNANSFQLLARRNAFGQFDVR